MKQTFCSNDKTNLEIAVLCGFVCLLALVKMCKML